jgi:hypothetical protein
MTSLEVKVTGDGQNKRYRRYEIIWLDWTEFSILPTWKRAGSRQLVTNGTQAFQVLRARARERYLIANGFDPKAE